METLGKLEPAKLATHSHAVAARLMDCQGSVGLKAFETLRKLEPAKLAQHTRDLLLTFGDPDDNLLGAAIVTLKKLPRFVSRVLDFDKLHIAQLYPLRLRILGRLAWYRYRLRLRVQRLALYWYALPYRPSGPGHARDVEAWGRMSANPGQRDEMN